MREYASKSLRFFKSPLVAVPTILFLAALSLSLHINPLVRPGTAVHYWEKACGIELGAYEGETHYIYDSGIYPKRDDWYVYYLQRHHDQPLFKVGKEEVEALLPQVVSKLSLPVAASRDRVCAGRSESFCTSELHRKNEKRKTCLLMLEQDERSEKAFLDRLSQLTTATLASPDADRLERMTSEFDARWKHAKLVWITCGFEFVFLVCWWLFTFAPRIVPSIAGRWWLNLMLSPLLLMLPHYLGYAPYLFTFGPSGGIVYPIVALLITLPASWIPPSSVDVAILSIPPRPLAWISQVPGEAMAWSYRFFVGPVAALLYGASLVAIATTVAWARRRIGSALSARARARLSRP